MLILSLPSSMSSGPKDFSVHGAWQWLCKWGGREWWVPTLHILLTYASSPFKLHLPNQSSKIKSLRPSQKGIEAMVPLGVNPVWVYRSCVHKSSLDCIVKRYKIQVIVDILSKQRMSCDLCLFPSGWSPYSISSIIFIPEYTICVTIIR